MNFEQLCQAVLKTEIPVARRSAPLPVIFRDEDNAIARTDPEHLGQNPLRRPRVSQGVEGNHDPKRAAVEWHPARVGLPHFKSTFQIGRCGGPFGEDYRVRLLIHGGDLHPAAGKPQRHTRARTGAHIQRWPATLTPQERYPPPHKLIVTRHWVFDRLAAKHYCRGV